MTKKTQSLTARTRRSFDSSKLWSRRSDNGCYSNPIISADYSDPDVIRHGDDFYMTASSFNCTPGLPILHSKDLVHWRIINHAIQNLPAKRFEQVQPGCGVWAPAIRYHDNKFWIFFGMPDEGIYVTTATDPASEWSTPRLVRAGVGLIDPCPLWDDDGNAYLAHAFSHSRSGIKHRLRVCPMSPDGRRIFGEGIIVYENPEKHPTIEGPKFLKKNGWYYILAPAGGVATGWQTVLRSRNVYGPYEDRVVLAQGSTPINGPHQGSLVETLEGEWWFVHFQDAGLYGRITHLQPAAWKDDWPLIGVIPNGGDIGEPVLNHLKPRVANGVEPVHLQTSDDFESSKLGLQWQWHANHREDWFSLIEAPGQLRLYAQPVPQDRVENAPHLLLQKFPTQEFTSTTSLHLGPHAEQTKAGLVVMGTTYAGVFVSRTESQLQIVQMSCDDSESASPEVVNEIRYCRDGRIWLRVHVQEGGVSRFSYSLDGLKFKTIGQLFKAAPGKWIGAKVGIVCLGQTSHADFDYFKFNKE